MTPAIHVSLRPAAPEDSEFIYQLLYETMRDYVVATWGSWDDARVRAESAKHALSLHARVIFVRDQLAGLITVERHSDHIQLQQLYLLPQFQRVGIGKLLMQNLLAEAVGGGRPVRLQVLQVNPAIRFYERLGFVTKAQTQERAYMEYPV
jgi:ribosomal protein S18 acetylase RimI-like enzyme